ncbi:MAG: DUF2764 family protein [Parachlamydiaceae bacterium]|nr:DUF2764 family protein [Parachlamydiaceae bacterium]
MGKNYFIGTLLPDLEIGQPAPISFEKLIQLFRDGLSTEENRQVEVIRRYFDIENLRAYWKGDILNPKGLLNKQELEESLFFEKNFPRYVFQFLDTYETVDLRLKHFAELIAAYYREEAASAKGFLKAYLIFERKLRLFQVAFRAFQLKRSLLEELHFESADEQLVQTLLDLEDGSIFLPPEEYEELHYIFKNNANTPIKLFQALSVYRFTEVQKIVNCGVAMQDDSNMACSLSLQDDFSIDRFLGYLVQLIIIEKWNELNSKDVGRHSDECGVDLEKVCGLHKLKRDI